jgi:hypothetical protein
MTVSTLLICGWPLLVVWAVIDVLVITPVRLLFGGRGPEDGQGPPST